MDDLKLYSDTNDNLQKLLKRTQSFSRDIRMEFGFEKCRTNAIKQGKWEKMQDKPTESMDGDVIKAMTESEKYKYLGFEQNRGINTKEIKKNLMEEIRRRTTATLRTKLSARNMSIAINIYAIPALTYSFGIVGWTETDLEELNRTIRTLFTKFRAHHPRSSVERFHLTRRKGGRGITDIKNLCFKQLQQLRNFFQERAETSKLHRVVVRADNGFTPLNLSTREYRPEDKIITDEQKMQKWRAKELHGRYIHMLDDNDIDKKASVAWMFTGNIFPETEGFMVAIQDHVIATLNYRKYIMKDATASSMCRICHQHQETIEHILNGCTPLASREYTKRHDDVAKIIHQALCHKYNVIGRMKPYYQYQPEPVIDTDHIKLYWNRTVLTDRSVMSNRPDITLTIKEAKTTYLIDIAIPSPKNISAKHREKIEKYIPLAYDFKDTRNQQKVTIVPIIVGATAEIPTRLQEELRTLGLPVQIYKHLQKAVVLNSCNILRKVLSE